MNKQIKLALLSTMLLTGVSCLGGDDATSVEHSSRIKAFFAEHKRGVLVGLAAVVVAGVLYRVYEAYKTEEKAKQPEM